VDAIAGEGNRSKFVADIVGQELRRRRQLDALRASRGIWKDKDHPDLAAMGEDEWVRRQRREGEARFKRLLRSRRKP